MYTYIYFILFLFTLQRNDEEAVVDRGGTRSILKTHFEKEDLEGELLFWWGSDILSIGITKRNVKFSVVKNGKC